MYRFLHHRLYGAKSNFNVALRCHGLHRTDVFVLCTEETHYLVLLVSFQLTDKLEQLGDVVVDSSHLFRL